MNQPMTDNGRYRAARAAKHMLHREPETDKERERTRERGSRRERDPAREPERALERAPE